MILTPQEITLEGALQFIKGGYSHAVGQSSRGLEVWQKGFTDHRIRDAEDYSNHKQYLEMNPVRAGLCREPGEYRYSSANEKFQCDELPQRLKPEFVRA